MLILTRKAGESILIDDNIEIILTDIKHGSVRVGIKAPRGFVIYRKEIYERIQKENRSAAGARIKSQEFDNLNSLLVKHLGGKGESH